MSIFYIFLCYSYYMEYEQFIVSLYKEGELSCQSGMFICAQKRADKTIITLDNARKDAQYLFIHFKTKCILIKIDNKSTFLLDHEFTKQESYLFCLYCEGEKFIGIYNNVGKLGKILKAIDQQYLKLKNERQFVINKNKVTDDLVYKLFNVVRNDTFFDQIKDNLIHLFSVFSRNKDLENMFKCSKFIECKNGDENSYLGIIYRDNKPFLLAVGCEKPEAIVPADVGQYCYITSQTFQNGQQGVFLSFRRASDGELYFEENLILRH